MTRKKTYVIIIIRNRTEGVVAVVKMGAGFTKKILFWEIVNCRMLASKNLQKPWAKKEVLKFIEYSKVKMLDLALCWTLNDIVTSLLLQVHIKPKTSKDLPVPVNFWRITVNHLQKSRLFG